MYMFLYVIKKELLHRRHVGYWQILLRYLHWIFTRVLEKKLLALPEHLSSSPFNSVCNFQCSILSTIIYLYVFFFFLDIVLFIRWSTGFRLSIWYIQTFRFGHCTVCHLIYRFSITPLVSSNFSFWPLYCLSSDLQVPNTPLVYSNFSLVSLSCYPWVPVLLDIFMEHL